MIWIRPFKKPGHYPRHRKKEKYEWSTNQRCGPGIVPGILCPAREISGEDNQQPCCDACRHEPSDHESGGGDHYIGKIERLNDSLRRQHDVDGVGDGGIL